MSDKSDKKEKQHLSKEKTSLLVSLLFSFLISILLVLLLVLVILRISLSESNLQKLAADKTYQGIILGDIQNSAHDYTLPTGIDPSILEGVFEATEVSRDVKIAISNAFAGIKDSEPDTSELKNRIVTRATAFYAQSDEQLAEVDMEAVVKAYANDIAEIYTNGLKIIGIEYVNTINSYLTRYSPVAMLLVALLIGVLAMMCVRMHHYPHRGLRFVAYATGAAALSVFAGPCALYVSGIYTRINISYHSLYYILTAFISHFLFMFFAAAAVLLVVTVVLIVYIGQKRKKVIKAESDN